MSEFKDKTTAINQLWQTDFTYLKVLGWGWFYLSTILDDYSRYIIAWKLCTNMRAEQYSATVAAALWCRGRLKSRPLWPFHLMGGLGDIHRGIIFESASRPFSGWVERAADSSGFWDQPGQRFEDVGVFRAAWIPADGGD